MSSIDSNTQTSSQGSASEGESTENNFFRKHRCCNISACRTIVIRVSGGSPCSYSRSATSDMAEEPEK